MQPDTDPSFIAKALGYFEPIEKKHNVKIVFREFAYGAKSKIGTFPDALMTQAKKQGWIVISMKNDWRRIFAFEP